MTVDSAFTTEQYDSAYEEGVEGHFWNFARTRIVERHLRKVSRDPKRPVLDVGCGVGLVVSHLRSRGIAAFGVELGRPRVRTEAAEFVRTGVSAENLPAEQRLGIETILLLDVIEHIEKPVEFLVSLRSAYPNLKTILFTVPARMELWSSWDETYGHFIRYDTASAKALVSSAGLSLVRLKYFFQALYIPMHLIRRSSRSTESRKPAGIVALAHRFIGWCFLIEERFSLPLPGSSMLLVAKV
jgi:2-polyprenyl-3-methyl-5-hydroxy-6-metoxy-1,4-benzoquinol methylase